MGRLPQFLVLALLASAGCHQPPDQAAKEARERAGSWAMTAKIAVEQWAIDIVPRHFVESTITAAVDDLTRESARVRKAAGPEAAAPLDNVRAALPKLSTIVKQSDETAALAFVSNLVSTAQPEPTPPTARPD